jgi:hypothetical protein
MVIKKIKLYILLFLLLGYNIANAATASIIKIVTVFRKAFSRAYLRVFILYRLLGAIIYRIRYTGYISRTGFIRRAGRQRSRGDTS